MREHCWGPLDRWWWRLFCDPVPQLKQWAWRWWWQGSISVKLWHCHACRRVAPSCVVCNPFPWVTFLSNTIVSPCLKLASETCYIFHELPRKWIFLVTDCMLKPWKMKAPNICFRKTQWKILSSSLFKLHQPECHFQNWHSVVKLIGTPWASLRYLFCPERWDDGNHGEKLMWDSGGWIWICISRQKK